MINLVLRCIKQWEEVQEMSDTCGGEDRHLGQFSSQETAVLDECGEIGMGTCHVYKWTSPK